MKQILIVLIATLLVVSAYMFYSSAKTSSPKRPKGRPDLQQQTRPGKVRPKATALAESAKEAADEFLGEDDDSWKAMVSAETLVLIEDAWSLDVSGVDFDADVLLTMELPDGTRVEITQTDWQKYLCISLGQQLIASESFAIAARSVAAEYDEPFGMTDEEWANYLVAAAEAIQFPMENYLARIARLYKGYSQETAMLARRRQIESLLAYFPVVQDAYLLPMEVQTAVDIGYEAQYLNMLNGNLREVRADYGAEGAMAVLANSIEPLAIIYTKVPGEVAFRRCWTFLDAELPDDAVVGCFTGNLVTDSVLPPWLQPDGGFEYLSIDDILPKLSVENLEPLERDKFLKELVWHRVLNATQVAENIALSPEEAWGRYAEEFIERADTKLGINMIISGWKGYPSLDHYRAVCRVFEGASNLFPENWKTEDVQRGFYDSHRIFVESWSPQAEIILFSPRRLDGDLSVDWEYARTTGEQVREQIISGELEFSAYRNRHHAELKELFRERMGAAVASDFEETFREGLIGDTVYNQQAMLKEHDYGLMMDLGSVVRNAIVRLDRGEISPLWKSPIGYLLIKVHGVGLTSLEGEWEDFRAATREEYKRVMFYKWANEALTAAKQVVVN